MIAIDHITLVVDDVNQAKAFFALFGFMDEKTVILSNKTFSDYLNVKNIHAEHHTLVLKNTVPRFEIQLLKYLDSHSSLSKHAAPKTPNPTTQGFHHLCFAVEDIEATLEKCLESGIKLKNNPMTFNDRKLVFLEGPANITVELAQWI
ncbi:VOC family protein [Shewanella surugensis]|uniref:VOC family protein n=1 Tax=Shewanella surugensis TaxID=212020 RepID=A0ABT0LDN3_9GAMM|nr:VOC family protein [Shewanella surugensis]MCL1125427.1 VOC family protein [Shewanella surugensis]